MEWAAQAANLGIGGVSILVMWFMYKSSAEERKRNDERMDNREKVFRDLEREVRDKIMSQLNDNTKAFERVIDHIQSH